LCAGALGVDAEVDEPFRCVVPGHHERDNLARIVWDEQTNSFKYHDMHLPGSSGGRWKTLAEVRAAQAYGNVVRLARAESALAWWPRLGYEIGATVPLDPRLPALPEHASSTDWRTADGLALLIGLRALIGPRGPVAFSARFGAAWCALPDAAVKQSVGALVRWGVVKSALRPMGRWPTTTLTPGTGSQKDGADA
jgi:hypothetical protein